MAKSYIANAVQRRGAVFCTVLSLSALLVTACGNSEDDAGTGGGGGGACGSALTCDSFSSVADQLGTYAPGSAANLFPADFPAPPSTATLCGSVTYASGDGMAGFVYYLNEGSDADLTAYYQAALSAAGYTLGAATPVDISSRPCDTNAELTGGSEDLTLSELYIYGSQGGFALGPFPVTQ